MLEQNFNMRVSIELDKGSRNSLQPEPVDFAELLHPSLEFVSISDRDLSSEVPPKINSLERVPPMQEKESKQSLSIDSAKIDSLIEEQKMQSLPEVD